MSEEHYTVKEQLDRIEAAINDVLRDHESRIRTMEKRWWALPITALVALYSAFFPQ